VSGERTEAATPRRLQKLRDEGRAIRSPELISAIGLLGGLIILQISASAAGDRIQGLLNGALSDMAVPTGESDLLWAEHIIGRATQAWLLSVAPLAAMPAVAILVGFGQGPIFSFKSLFKLDHLNPISGFQRLFSMQSLMNLGRSLAKVAILAWVTFNGLQQVVAKLPQIEGSADPRVMISFIGESILNVGLPAAEVLVGLAIADYAYQRWSFNRQARMSKDEVKEEHKQQEGDPLVKGQIRARQRKMAQQRRQLQDVPNAAVVVTNPTHFAVALQYDRGMASPKVIAKGTDLIAQKIKEVARASGVPIVENKPLARGLFKATEVGDDIPLELYQAVAEVLAYVFSLRRRRRA
jgi:flagellar biosynthesis protein FlhB